ncbi:hypothetical protein H072_6468 [Dactylellina haptotyla CBS 200.50]|uniref:Uncharacterized protein n=1 Tax=Dactylellina haptotyla (strain CBS 200.50) TaxID=1284197 RepID=S8A9R4_DACHA|nr:hypothetical protein H072_6468 [Dactylellina haptotyla CBS 200.50]
MSYYFDAQFYDDDEPPVLNIQFVQDTYKEAESLANSLKKRISEGYYANITKLVIGTLGQYLEFTFRTMKCITEYQPPNLRDLQLEFGYSPSARTIESQRLFVGNFEFTAYIGLRFFRPADSVGNYSDIIGSLPTRMANNFHERGTIFNCEEAYDLPGF